MNLESISTKVLSAQHQLLSVQFTADGLAHLREQAKTKKGEDRSDRLAGECSYQPEWLDQEQWIEHLCKEYLKTFKPELQNNKLDIFASWLVFQKGDNFNPIHNHSGDISGVIYLDCPEDVINENWQQGHSKQAGLDILLNNGELFHIRPKPGTGVLFHSLTNHCAYPYKTETDAIRLSASFNAKVI